MTSTLNVPSSRAPSGNPAALAQSRNLPELFSAAQLDIASALRANNSTLSGLSEAQAKIRLARHGPNEIGRDHPQGWPIRLLKAFKNPLVILVGMLAIASFSTGDLRAGGVMTLIVIVGVALRFVQEFRADNAADKLKAMIHTTATILRDGQPAELPLRWLVPGDVIQLAAGDMIPGDVRLITSKDLFINQATLTGESIPVEKRHDAIPHEGQGVAEFANICLMGASVESGSATALVLVTGPRTFLGGMASALQQKIAPTSFDQGISHLTWLMIRLIAIMVPLVFLITGLTKHDWKGAFFFAMAIAVGLTPEMLPMIVSVCLSKGAMAMSKKRVIVKRLSAIQNLGAMDVLCTDKTGTLTLDRVILERHCDVSGDESDDVLLHAYLISHFQTGLKNVLDRSILNSKDFHAQERVQRYKKVDEIPFDYSRRIMSVAVEMPEGKTLILSKGAPEEIFHRCAYFELDGQRLPIDQLMTQDLKEEYEDLSNDGFRVLAIAYRELPAKPAYTQADECELVLQGYVAFLDPPKDSAAPAIVALARHGVSVKVLTGDNPLVTRKVCAEVGLETQVAVLGADVDAMSDQQLAQAVEENHIFARLAPAHKQRIIRALQTSGHVVGYLGDGANDAPALRMADVGISVDTAVDVAREAASIILLKKSLTVLDDGVIEGRKVFANILKYIRMGASSNFGNVLSILGASLFLPFLPMLPIQVLTNNLLYDISQIPIPTDDVDPEQLAHPRPWRLPEIRRFILTFGPLSSIFDYVMFAVLLWGFGCWDVSRAPLFQTGWFIESLLTQTLIIHVIRTRKIPFFQSRASPLLTFTTALVVAIGVYLPFSPFGTAMGFVQPPLRLLPIIAIVALCYAGLCQLAKVWFVRVT